MKKISSFVFAVLLSLAFSACDKTTPKTTTTMTTENVCIPAPGEICPS